MNKMTHRICKFCCLPKSKIVKIDALLSRVVLDIRCAGYPAPDFGIFRYPVLNPDPANRLPDIRIR